MNTSGDSDPATLTIDGFRPADKTAVYTLSWRPGDENLPGTPDCTMPTALWIGQPGTEFVHTFKPYSYTVLRMDGRRE